MKTAAILVAAGSSARMKSGGASKTMMEIGGEPVLSRTLRAFENAACISKIVIVARACDFDAIQKASAFVTKPLTITAGGKERQDSVSNGAALCGDAEYIAVHDAARPFITPEEIETVCADAEKYGAATLAVPVKDTIKVAAADGTVCATPERSTLRAIQTPQVFRAELLRRLRRDAADGLFRGAGAAEIHGMYAANLHGASLLKASRYSSKSSFLSVSVASFTGRGGTRLSGS